MKFIKKNLLIKAMLLAIFVFLISAGFFLATAAPAGMPTGIELPIKTLPEVITRAINWIAGLVALIAVIMVLISGVLWITAGGSEERAKSARRFLVGGLAGLAVALGAWALVKVVVYNFFEISS